MKFYSTNNPELRVSLNQAVFQAMPSDGGLYMPERIVKIDPMLLTASHAPSFQDIAFHVAKCFLGEDIPLNDLRAIVDDALSFDAPVRLLSPSTGVLELFHGPSFAFKDFGARFMSRLMAYLAKDENRILDVLVATSGDTGGAVALGFLGVPGTRVTILYPKGKVSKIQEQQLTTNGKNIRALEVDGTFDDCQALVKQAFADKELGESMRLTSANSINISRLIPQCFYYFWAYYQLLCQGANKVVFTVPSGNFGNIAAGLLAQKMGLPVEQFIAATNSNDVVPNFLSTGEFKPRKSVQTLSNAMDVGNPSNWVRIMDLFAHNTEELAKQVTAYSFNDEDTKRGMRELYEKYGYIACPHTAIGYLASERYRLAHKGEEFASIFLSTAHPCKFPEALDEELYSQIQLPEGTEDVLEKKKEARALKPDFKEFKAYLLENNN